MLRQVHREEIFMQDDIVYDTVPPLGAGVDLRVALFDHRWSGGDDAALVAAAYYIADVHSEFFIVIIALKPLQLPNKEEQKKKRLTTIIHMFESTCSIILKSYDTIILQRAYRGEGNILQCIRRISRRPWAHARNRQLTGCPAGVSGSDPNGQGRKVFWTLRPI